MSYDRQYRPIWYRSAMQLRRRWQSSLPPSFKSTLLLPTAAALPRNVGDPGALQPYTCDALYSWQTTLTDRPLFLLHDGPPFANGDLHVGHFLNKTLKDTVLRARLLDGHRVQMIPGWDCHGLPIEMKVKAKGSCDRSVSSIRSAAHELACSVVVKHRTEMQSWGLLADWPAAYRTMNPSYEAEQLGVFAQMFAQGLIYRAHKPVHWSPSSRTALAEAELEYRLDHSSTAVYVGIPIVSGPFPNLQALIWTTTPWTLPANRAIAFSLDLDYCIVTCIAGRFLVASCRVEPLKVILGNSLRVEVARVSHDVLSAMSATHPIVLSHAAVPFVSSPFVTGNIGTGLVHTAPGHGKEDYLVGVQSGLANPIHSPVDGAGLFTSEVGVDQLIGKPVLGEGQNIVLKLLTQSSRLVHNEPYCHSYPYDWRTKRPIIQRATPQWFVKIDNIRNQAIASLGQVNFAPESGKTRLKTMIENRDEWCISRQRYWGVPIPVFYSLNGETLLTLESIQHVRKLFALHGSSCWWSLPLQELLPPSHRHRVNEFVRGQDTLDVWFDSGCSWSAVVRRDNGERRSDLVIEGSDQHRGWFQSSLLTSASCTQQAPYRNVLTHGYVLDEKSRKMSKSLGNVVSSRQLMSGPKPYDIDVLRFWVFMSDFTSGWSSCVSIFHICRPQSHCFYVRIGADGLEKAADCLRRLRNSARFLLGCLTDFSLQHSIKLSEMPSVDRYALHILFELTKAIREGYGNNYQMSRVASALIQFNNSFLSPFYLHTSKDRLYADERTSLLRRSCQTVIMHTLSVLTKAIAPMTPHTAQQIFQQMSPELRVCFDMLPSSELTPNRPASVFAYGGLPDGREWQNSNLAKQWSVLMTIRDHSNLLLEKARDQTLIGSSMQAQVVISAPAESALDRFLGDLGPEQMAAVFSVSSAIVANKREGDFLFEHSCDIVDADSNMIPVHVAMRLAPGDKCSRCWKQHMSVSSDARNICSRCSRVLAIDWPNLTTDSESPEEFHQHVPSPSMP